MPRRRVLIISHVFPPLVAGGAPRMGQFARLLPEFGWDVTVLTARHKGVDTRAVEQLSGRATIVETWSPSTVVPRGQSAPRRGLRALARSSLRIAARSVLFPDREIAWVPGAIRAGRAVLEQTPHDVVLATYGPGSNLIVGRALARHAHLPLIVDFRDLWSTITVDNFASSLHRAAARRLERSIVRAASRLIAVAPEMTSELLTTHGVDAERGATITNGFDPDDVKHIHDARQPGQPFRLLYTGTVTMHYNLEPFWRTIRAMGDEGRITPATFRIEFVGNLAVSDLRAFGIEAFVDSKPYVPHAAVFDELARADALLLIETPGYYARYSYTAKVFDYLLTGKPVLAMIEHGGNTARLLDQARVGHLADPRSESEIRNALERVLALKGAAPRDAAWETPALAAFDRRALTRRLAAALDEVARTEPRGHW